MKLFSFDILLLGFTCAMLYNDNSLTIYYSFDLKLVSSNSTSKYISDVGWKICAAP